MKGFIDHVTLSSRHLRKDVKEVRAELNAIRASAEMILSDFGEIQSEAAAS
jgi:hypothetical protein